MTSYWDDNKGDKSYLNARTDGKKIIKILRFKSFLVWINVTVLTVQFLFIQEAIAMARLKRDILQVTGNVHFYKAGNAYVVFQVDKDKQSSATCEEKQEPYPESSA